jgi:CheY-like chemotaxis protein
VTRDPPFSKLDLISCCNLLIYLSAALQERVIPVLHYALKPTGFLKLGPSESVARFTNLFSVVDKKHKIYTRKPGPSAHLGFGLTADHRVATPGGTQEKETAWSPAAIEREADRLILGRYAPAGVVINADMEIVQFRGKTGPYLEARPGAASLNLFMMAREGLAAALRQTVKRAAKSDGPVKTEGLRVKANGTIVRHLVELHGGAVQAESAGPEQGAAFTVTLPLTEERPADEAEIRTLATRGVAVARLPALGGVRVLVVDDEADMRELLRTILGQCGAEVTVAATGRTALEVLEQAPFDVLVSDIVMPEDDGYDLIRKVRALDEGRGGRIPALALTAHARIEDRVAALSAGYQQHAAKPIDPAELAAAVAALAGRGEGKRGA